MLWRRCGAAAVVLFYEISPLQPAHSVRACVSHCSHPRLRESPAALSRVVRTLEIPTRPVVNDQPSFAARRQNTLSSFAFKTELATRPFRVERLEAAARK